MVTLSPAPDCSCPGNAYLYGSECVENKKNVCTDPNIADTVVSLLDDEITWTGGTPFYQEGSVSSRSVIFNGFIYGNWGTTNFGGGAISMASWIKFDFTSVSVYYAPIRFYDSSTTNNLLFRTRASLVM